MDNLQPQRKSIGLTAYEIPVEPMNPPLDLSPLKNIGPIKGVHLKQAPVTDVKNRINQARNNALTFIGELKYAVTAHHEEGSDTISEMSRAQVDEELPKPVVRERLPMSRKASNFQQGV
jgi:hypothetical protein